MSDGMKKDLDAAANSAQRLYWDMERDLGNLPYNVAQPLLQTARELLQDLRAIAALSPAPSEGDALAEFMKREGAVKHEPYTFIEVNREPRYWLYSSGHIQITTDPTILGHEEGRIVASAPVLPSEPAAEEAMVRAIATETCIACGGNINLDVSDDERDPDMGLGEDGWQCGDCTRKYIGGGSGAGPDTITIASSSQHAEESSRAQDPLLPPEPPPVATPEQLMESGAIKGEAYGLWRNLVKAGS